MDPSALVSVLQLALSTNPDERKAGEERLHQYHAIPGHLLGFLQIVVASNLDISLRQVAAIHFKNLVARNWNSSESVALIPESEKSAVRENILEALIHAPAIARVQLCDGLRTIVHSDFPDRWPSLLPCVNANLRAQDQQRVFGALFVLRILTRKYEFKDDDERIPVFQIIDMTFPTLLEIFKYLLSMQSPSIEVADLMKLICKVFWSSTYMTIPKQLQDPNVFTVWIACFYNLLERPVPENDQPIDPEKRKVWAWWKVKKWTVHIMNRLFNRFGDPKTANAENKEFAQLFQTKFAGKLLECHLALLEVLPKGGYLPDRVINLVLQYLSSSISNSVTYQLLKPRLDVVVFEIIFPLMCFNDSDDKLWHEDPHEFVRKGYDIIEDMYSPRTAAINFIAELIRKRGKENLQKFLAYVVDIFTSYNRVSADTKLHRKKDGGLLAVGALSDKLKRTEPYKSQLEQMLLQHVFPEFNSPVGHLRAKAAWVSGQYANISFADQNNFRTAMKNIVSALRDPELPVRVDSVVALRTFVDACKDLDELRPILPQLLDEFFKLMNEVENEDLVFTLETIVDKFGEEMGPYAIGLCQNLAAAFWKCLQSADTDDEDDESGALAAVGCLRAISAILESISSLQYLFPQIEPILLPIMRKTLTESGQDVYEEILEIVSHMTLYSPSISLEMWTLWPLIVSAAEEWAVDFFQNILSPLENFISRSTEHFLTCKIPDYQKSLYEMISSLLNDPKLEDVDIAAAPKLIQVVLQNCRSRIDLWIEPYLRITIDRLRRTHTNYLKDLLIAVVANSLYYNAALTLSILQVLGITTELFQSWLDLLAKVNKNGKPVHFRRKHDKKICILGLVSVIALPFEILSRELQSGLPEIFKVVLKLLVAYKEQLLPESTKRVEIENAVSVEVDDWSDEPGDEEEGEEVSSHMHQSFSTQANAFMDDSDGEFSDDEERHVPSDNIDPSIFFIDIMKAISVSDPVKFQALSRSLDFQHQAMAHAITLYADEKRKAFGTESMYIKRL